MTADAIGRGIALRAEATDAIIGAGVERAVIGNCIYEAVETDAERTQFHRVTIGMTPNGDRVPSQKAAIKVYVHGANTTVGLEGAPFHTIVNSCCATPRTDSAQTTIIVDAPGFTLINAEVGVRLTDDSQDFYSDPGATHFLVYLTKDATDARIGIDRSTSAIYLSDPMNNTVLVATDAPNTVITNAVLGLDPVDCSTDRVFESAVRFAAGSNNSRFGTDGSPNRTYVANSLGSGVHILSHNVTVANFAVSVLPVLGSTISCRSTHV